MEYYRTEAGHIQAEFARRLGLALRQYRKESSQRAHDYSDTLSLSILQSLLSSCMHLAEDFASSNRIKCFLSEPMGVSMPASSELIEFRKALPRRPEKFIDFLKILRDSMSHPNPITDLPDNNMPTGFTSIRDGNGVLNRIRFVWAPSVHNRGRLMGFKTKEAAEEWAYECINEDSLPHNRLVVEEYRGFWYVRNTLADEVVLKGVIVELSCDQVYSLTIALSTLLAQPLNKNWDQQTIIPLEVIVPLEYVA